MDKSVGVTGVGAQAALLARCGEPAVETILSLFGRVAMTEKEAVGIVALANRFNIGRGDWPTIATTYRMVLGCQTQG